MTAHVITPPRPFRLTCCHSVCPACEPSPCPCGGDHLIDTDSHHHGGREWHPDCCPRCRLVDTLRADGNDFLAGLIADGALTDDDIDEVLS